MMKKRNKEKRGVVVFSIAILLFFIISVVAGCGAASDNIRSESGVAYDMAEAEAPSASAPAPVPDVPKDAAFNEDSVLGSGRGITYAAAGELAPDAAAKRYIIQNAQLTMEIRDIDKTVDALQELTDQTGGYVASREIYDIGDERRAGRVSLRVPADRFATVLSAVKDLGKTKNEHVDTDDVTREYIDLEARITNLAAQEKRLRELLEKAESIEDIMQVERELGRIRGELEAMEGNFRYLRERVQYSTVDIRLEERDVRTLVVDDKLSGFGERLANLLALNTNRLIEGFTGFIIVTIGFLPIILPLLVIAFLIWKIRTLFKKRNMDKKEQQHSEQQHNQSQ